MNKIKYTIKGWWNKEKTNFITDILEKIYKIEYDDKKPDIVICSIFKLNIELLNMRYKDALKILYIGESYGLNKKEEIEKCISISFDKTTETNIQYVGQYPENFYINLDELFNNRIYSNDYFNRKFCINIMSSPLYSRHQERIHICDIIEQYKKQDYGGKWRNNIGCIQGNYLNVPNFIKNYKFNFCPENYKDEYYITEKLINVYLGNTIPIYFGGNSDLIFNKNSYINLNNKSDEEIIDIIKNVNENEKLYKEMFCSPILKDSLFFTKQQKNIENFLIKHINNM